MTALSATPVATPTVLQLLKTLLGTRCIAIPLSSHPCSLFSSSKITIRKRVSPMLNDGVMPLEGHGPLTHGH